MPTALILAVEHDMSFVRHVAQRVTVSSGPYFYPRYDHGVVADELVAAIIWGKAMRKEVLLSTLKLRSG